MSDDGGPIEDADETTEPVEDTDEEGTEPAPHKAIKFLGIIVGATVIGATAGAFAVPPFDLGELLVAIALTMLALAGSFGVVKGEPILGALAGLGFLLVLEPLVEIGVVLLIGAFGFLAAATLVAVESYLRNRDD